MKSLFLIALVLAWNGSVNATLINVPVNQAIPDGDGSGLASTVNVNGVTGPITGLQVDLSISGTFNGDLYAHLAHESGFTVLLNRVGVVFQGDLGYGDAGLNVRFSDAASDIHNYRMSLFGNDTTSLSGPLTGTWGPDGRTAPPVHVGDSDPRTALLASFQGGDPNGAWTLFVADMSGGDTHQLNSWALVLNEIAAPIPASTMVLLLFALVALILAHRLHPTRKRPQNPTIVT